MLTLLVNIVATMVFTVIFVFGSLALLAAVIFGDRRHRESSQRRIEG
jgi:hypothetical protein